MPAEPTTWVQFLLQGGAAAALVAVVWAGASGRFIWKTNLEKLEALWREMNDELKADRQAMQKDRDMWRDRALFGLNQTDKALDVAKTAVTKDASS